MATSSRIFWLRAMRTLTGWTGTWSAWRKPARSGRAGWSVSYHSHHQRHLRLSWFPPTGKGCTRWENLLTRLRDGQLTLNPELTTALLGMVDAVRQMLGSIDVSGGEGERDDTKLIATLTRLQAVARSAGEERSCSRAGAHLRKRPSCRLRFGDILMQRAGVTQAEILLAVEKQKEGDPRRMGEILVEQGAAGPPMSWMRCVSSSPRAPRQPPPTARSVWMSDYSTR